ncbi:MobA/MobL family protein [Salmonella enterica]|nr:MobA/MobL family protein [Salmonella enterica]
MASYHLTVKTGAKGSGASHAAYISREDKYANKERYEDLEHKQHGNMPSWAKDNPLLLWQAADNFERSNGTAYREFEVALPRELTPDQRLELVNDFIKNEIGDRHAYQFAIHCPKAGIEGKEQPHAHIMFCERINDGIDRDPAHFFKRANSKNPEMGGAKKASAPQSHTQRKEALIALRERWANLQNNHLEKHGHADRVDHRSLKEQGIDREPEKHMGPKRVYDLTISQASAILERRAAERELEQANAIRDSLIDLSGDLRGALAERDARAGVEEFKRSFAGKQEFMRGFEEFKQEQQRQRDAERQEQLRKEQARTLRRENDRGYEHD